MNTSIISTHRIFFKREIQKVIVIRPAAVFLNTREQVLYILDHCDLSKVKPYLRKLVADAAARIWMRRYNPHMLDFDHNEAIMLERLYRSLC